jgi:hypothetical protein
LLFDAKNGVGETYIFMNPALFCDDVTISNFLCWFSVKEGTVGGTSRDIHRAPMQAGTVVRGSWEGATSARSSELLGELFYLEGANCVNTIKQIERNVNISKTTPR